jgi:hypothetical protein
MGYMLSPLLSQSWGPQRLLRVSMYEDKKRPVLESMIGLRWLLWYAFNFPAVKGNSADLSS